MNNDPTNSPATGDGTKEILLFQLGPVQDFIAQARSTRDLWSGSYMLSWLVAHAIKKVLDMGNVGYEDMIKPSICPEDNPLLFALRDRKTPACAALSLIPNLPNVFAMLVPAGTGLNCAKGAQDAVVSELKSMGNSVWNWLLNHGAKEAWKTRWDAQIEAFPQIAYAVREWKAGETFRDAYADVNKQLAARRNTRNFAQWNACGDSAVKDSLSGREECIGDEAFWAGLRRDVPERFKQNGHSYGAVNLIKRLWMNVEDADEGSGYLANALAFYDRPIRKLLKVDSIQEIAKRNKDSNVPYVAVLAFDGDHMGKTIDRQKDSPDGIRAVSSALSSFALGQVPKIVEEHQGHLIYAGGDDVLAILPSSKAVDCAQAIRQAFRDVGTHNNFEFDGSCGIAVGHKNAPLQMLVTKARRMEGVAKHKYERQSLAIALYKRSGEIIEWGCKWDSDALPLMREVTKLSDGGKLSGRFPYALAALLRPYELEELHGIDWDNFRPVVELEFAHVLERQGANMSREDRTDFLTKGAVPYLASEGLGKHPEDFVNLFLVETFLNRERKEM